jgi:hypothetical protein
MGFGQKYVINAVKSAYIVVGKVLNYESDFKKQANPKSGGYCCFCPDRVGAFLSFFPATYRLDTALQWAGKSD